MCHWVWFIVDLEFIVNWIHISTHPIFLFFIFCIYSQYIFYIPYSFDTLQVICKTVSINNPVSENYIYCVALNDKLWFIKENVFFCKSTPGDGTDDRTNLKYQKLKILTVPQIYNLRLAEFFFRLPN